MVHGISTSCQTLGRVARQLVDYAGCRVMLFDWFGRGFSDGVGDLPHDERLYCSQMLCALVSSPLSWAGDAAFDLVGYSMGGGVAVHFAIAFPGMLRSLILLAPAGLIRPQRFGVAARLIFTSGIVPERLLASITRRRLRRPIASGQKARRQQVAAAKGTNPAGIVAATEEDTGLLDMAVAEVVDAHGAATEPEAPEPQGAVWSMQVGRYVRWMLSHHDGFVPAFMSCIRFAPLIGQEQAWQQLARLVQGSPDAKGKDGLALCVVLGRHDDVVDTQDYEVDALPLFGGADAVTWTVIPGGHDFPMTYSRHVLRAIFGFWSSMNGALARLQAEEDKEAALGGEGTKAPNGVSANGEEGLSADSVTCRPAGVETMA